MQGETAGMSADGCRIVDIGDFSGRKQGKPEKQRRRVQEADDKFASLDGRNQRKILLHMIGYLEASKDLVSSGKRARPNEVSRTFEVMEDLIDKAWNGGMV